MKPLLFILSLCFAFNLYAQNTTEKSFSSEQFSAINIDGAAVFKIVLGTTRGDSVLIQARAEGENSEHIRLLTNIENNTLLVSARYQPLFVDANDKLSAHKVVSVELHINIPAQMGVYVSSDIATVIANGTYKKLTVELRDGSCFLYRFSGYATINTVQGHIRVTTNHAKIEAQTSNGKLKVAPFNSGSSYLSLNSINGNISVNKSQ